MRKPGVWNSELGDVLILAMSNFLDRPITIYTSDSTNNIIEIDSQDFQDKKMMYAYVKMRVLNTIALFPFSHQNVKFNRKPTGDAKESDRSTCGREMKMKGGVTRVFPM
ncbi:hypothetical protein RRG08_036770 [Elysia crispata]|uniref:OTU domain-containing protein n=1 Tax=Elysia crispata TaxID=231223 RepID=A0AAE0Y940_9GAST|nr:hypothetical protein RRG08_036770 [Elysia crispata]